jgi:BolA-like protein 3
VEVNDISGGCGAMYNIDVESPLFKGKSIVQQHQLVQQVLREDMKSIHGLNLKTRVPK